MNNPNWMGDVLTAHPVFGLFKINEVLLPGSHDSGTFRAGPTEIGDQEARTQSLTFRQQLELGVRYFDLRVTLNNSVYYPYHGLWTSDNDLCKKGDDPDNADDNYHFKQMRRFLQQHTKEIIILKFQDFWAFTEDQHYFDLVKLLEDYFTFPGCGLVTPTDHIDTLTINDLLDAGQRVFVFFDEENVPDRRRVWNHVFKYRPTLEKLSYGLWDPYWREAGEDLADDNIDLNIRWWPFHQGKLSKWNNQGFFVLQSHMQQLPGKAVDNNTFYNISEQVAAATYYLDKDPQGYLIKNNARNIKEYIKWANIPNAVNIVTFDYVQHGDVCGAIFKNYMSTLP
jgi:hypothetical protein